MFFFVGKIRLHFLRVLQISCQVESMVLYPCKLKDFICPAMVQFYFENHLHVNLLNYEGLDLLLHFQWIKNSNARAVEQPCVY